MTKVRTFIVEGSGEFPFDMLRYDACWPSGQADVVAIADLDDTRRVRLCFADGIGGEKPCARRWASFNWRILEVDGLQKEGG